MNCATCNTTTNDRFDWPDVFITGVLDAPEPSTLKSRAKVCAEALCAWGNCRAGANPPAKFSEGMVLVGRYLGILATSDNLHAYADAIQKELAEEASK